MHFDKNKYAFQGGGGGGGDGADLFFTCSDFSRSNDFDEVTFYILLGMWVGG